MQAYSDPSREYMENAFARAVAEDWKWVHQGLTNPPCAHTEQTYRTNDETVERVCLTCRRVVNSWCVVADHA